MSPIPLFVLFSLTHLMFLSSAEENKYNSRCPPFPCGDLGPIRFPFNNKTNPECGVFTVHCSERIQKIQLKEGGHWYEIYTISQADSISIYDVVRPFYLDSTNSCESIRSFSLPGTSPVFSYNIAEGNFSTLFNCSRSLGISKPIDFNLISCGDYEIYYNLQNISFPFQQQCSSIHFPLPLPYPLPQHHPDHYDGYPDPHDKESPFSTYFTFDVHVTPQCIGCHHREGKCWANNKNEFKCLNELKGNKKLLKLGLGLGLGLGVPFLVLILVFFIWRRKQKRAASILSRSISDPYINSDLEEGSGYPGVLVFSYKDLQEATNNFHAEKELGDGGFGTVYHGKLKDGREVAVKRLYEHNYKRVEQFINEIEILTRLRHKNLVSLYGCTSRRCRELLLVYEYIPNGTVADHLHGDRAKTSPLSWPIRMSIAIETADALAYLHASDIVHRDVKTNNILLDDNFCVKVADFGLSRLFPNDVTHVSTAPQGTPGYVDPEYHQCYQLTSKSDVYSFGVVLVELISSMPAVDITRHRHEINLSNLAISKIKKRAYNELVDPCLGFDSDIQVKTMIIAVAELAFQCLQQDKEMRPSMDEVLETLKGIEIGNNETENEQRNETLDGSGLNMSTVRPPPSPDCDEVGLLERMKQEQPPSPNTVTVNWPSSRSTTPNISG